MEDTFYQEYFEKLYQEYLKDKLDLIFDNKNNETYKLAYNHFRIVDTSNDDGDVSISEKKDREFKEGFLIVEKDGKYNYIDEQGNYIKSHRWYDEAYDFEGGHACVKLNGKYNFIDYQGNYLSDKWYDDAYDFQEGYAVVTKNNKHNFIDTNGKFLLKEWLEELHDFEDGIATVKKNNKYSFINKNGKYVTNEWFDNVYDKVNGMHIVKRGKKFNYLDENYKLISGKWFDDVNDFEDEYGKVFIDYKENYINKEGKLVSPTFIKSMIYLGEGMFAVDLDTTNSSKNIRIMNSNGEYISYDYLDIIDLSFKNGLLPVYKDGKCNVINKEGKLLFDGWYKSCKVMDGYILIQNEKGNYNFSDYNGDIRSTKWYSEIKELSKKYLMLKSHLEYEDSEICNKNGKTMSKICFGYAKNVNSDKTLSNDDIILNYRCDGIIFSDDERYDLINDSNNNYLNGYNFKKRLLGRYICYNSTDKFKIKYYPLIFYGFRYILCISCRFDDLYLYDRENNSYEKLGKLHDIQFDNNIIKYDDRIYLMYNDNKIDITEYYERYKDKIFGKELVQNIKVLSKEDFFILSSAQRANFIKEEKEKNKKMEEEQQEETSKEMKEILEQLKDNITKLNELKKRLSNIPTPRIEVENIFMEKDNHKVIMDEIKNQLQFIDLTSVSFKNVDISGVNFSGCNIDLFPQEVYNKDLRGCDFTGVFIRPLINFNGVDIRGAKFSYDNDPSTYDIKPEFDGAIYDEETTYNGISLVDLLGPCDDLENKKAM